MYGDLQYTNGNFKWKGNSKVFKFKANPKTWPVDFIVGFAGVGDDIMTVCYYYANPEMFPKGPPRIRPGNASGLVLTVDRDLYRFDTYTHWRKMNEPYAAVGSGMEFALGAMAAGLDPKEAIKVAMKHDVYTGLGVKGYSI